jgi:hypothetical protein
MNLFRSGEHVGRWLDGRSPGETIGVERLSDLAHAWWGDRLSPDWVPRSREQNQRLLDGLGLVGPFWQLA